MGGLRPGTREDAHLFPSLPALPLARAVEKMADPFVANHNGMKAAAGISDRTLREWLSGGRQTARFDIADRVLCRICLNWWEVWNEDTVPDPATLALVAYAFTGEGAGEQLELAA